MKNHMYIIIMFLCAMNSSLVSAEQPSWVPVEVQHLYQAAQSGNTEGVENNLEWYRELDKKKPEHMLKEALKMAEIKNDAPTAVTLITRLKQEQMSSWERYFRGITLVATGAVIVATIVGFNSTLGNQQGSGSSYDTPREFTIPALPDASGPGN